MLNRLRGIFLTVSSVTRLEQVGSLTTRRHSESAYIRQDWTHTVGGTHTVEDWNECAQTHTQTHNSENSISASFTPFTCT